MNTVVLDDEPLAVALLTDYVNRHPITELAASFVDPIEALKFLRTTPVDLILLDIQMPSLNGLDVIRLLIEDCAIVLTTAYEEHALAGFELDVVDYLIKPISFDRFQKAVEKSRRRAANFDGGKGISATDPSLGPLGGLPPNTRAPVSTPFFVKSGNRTLRIDLSNLLYVSSEGDYLTLYLLDGSKTLTLENLTDFAARLPASHFCRIHRSHLIALDKIDFVERRRVVIGGRWLPVSDSFRAEFTRLIGR